jgi:pantoate--beta-alanine ligase
LTCYYFLGKENRAAKVLKIHPLFNLFSNLAYIFAPLEKPRAMHIFKEIEALRAFLHPRRTYQPRIGFVPTMGALHEGHLALIKQAKQENTITVCSIYVNPAQFNNPTDLEKYPRTFEADVALLEAEKCDILFAPDNATMYERPSILKFDFGHLDKELEGKFRPGHFSGVALVVAKLLNVVQPTRAYFGQKDYQQFLIVSKLVQELKFDLELICYPIIRESNGLAMSSRNKRLSEQGKRNAVILSESLTEAKQRLRDREPWGQVKKSIETKIESSGVARLEYLALADRTNLIALENVTAENLSKAIVLVAAYVEEVRLIDNLFIAD